LLGFKLTVGAEVVCTFFDPERLDPLLGLLLTDGKPLGNLFTVSLVFAGTKLAVGGFVKTVLHFVPDSIFGFTLTVGERVGGIDVIIVFVVTDSVLGFRLIVGESVCIVIPRFILLGFKLAVGDPVLITFTSVNDWVLGFRLIVGESVCIVIPRFILLGFELAVGDPVITFT
jgi:hypothetical protein